MPLWFLLQVTEKMTIAREEIFGPVMSVMKVRVGVVCWCPHGSACSCSR